MNQKGTNLIHILALIFPDVMVKRGSGMIDFLKQTVAFLSYETLQLSRSTKERRGRVKVRTELKYVGYGSYIILHGRVLSFI
jgi:hypothetical protein